MLCWDYSGIPGLRAILWRCYLSGDALHGSVSRINPIKCYQSCVIHYFPDSPGSLQLVPVTRIEQTGETNGGLEIFQWKDEYRPESGCRPEGGRTSES